MKAMFLECRDSGSDRVSRDVFVNVSLAMRAGRLQRQPLPNPLHVVMRDVIRRMFSCRRVWSAECYHCRRRKTFMFRRCAHAGIVVAESRGLTSCGSGCAVEAGGAVCRN